MAVEQGVSVAMLRPLSELLRRMDVDADRFLAALAIDRDSAPDTYVSGELADRLLDEIAAARGDPAFGLTLARAAVERPLGLFGHVVWLSGTMRDALSRAVKFFGAVSRRTTVALVEHDETVTVRQESAAGATRGVILTEFVFASLAMRARAATGGRFTIRAVRFAHAGFASDGYRDVFRAPVVFGAPADEVELHASQLALPLASADPITSAVLEPAVAQLASRARGRSALVDRGRRAAVGGLSRPLSPEAVARELGTSARTLRRRRENEGATLRAIVDELRRDKADELLANGSAVKDVAFQLGFSEPSAFRRAYKRWTGRPPRSR